MRAQSYFMQLAVPLTASVLALALVAACGDPANTDAIEALGGEVQGVRPGPQHRPGQPCLLCHTGKFGDPKEWSIAGTVFLAPTSNVAAVGAVVSVTDANKITKTFTTNAAGNFHLDAAEFKPRYPLGQISITYQGKIAAMGSLVNGNGACATCHVGDGNARKMPRLYVETK